MHYTAAPVLGGVEAIVESHRKLLAGAGWPVRVVAGRGDCELIAEVDSRHPEVEAIAVALSRGADVSARFDGLKALLREKLSASLRDCDLVIAHNVMTMPFNLPLAAALPEAGPPILAWTHDIAWVNPLYAKFQRPGWPYDLLHRPQPKTAYLAISELRREQLCEAYGLDPGGVQVVPNGVDRAAVLGLRPESVRFGRRAGFLDADPLVLVPFRITRRKRIELAIRAADELRHKWPALKIVVSGPLGPHSTDGAAYFEELRAERRRLHVDDRVIFLHELAERGRHPVDDEMMGELYQLAGAVLLTSESEGFGLPVLEAGLARVAVVCSDLPVFREAGGDDLWTFPVEAPAGSVAAALGEALMSRQARLQADVRRYEWERQLGRLEEVVRHAAA